MKCEKGKDILGKFPMGCFRPVYSILRPCIIRIPPRNSIACIIPSLRAVKVQQGKACLHHDSFGAGLQVVGILPELLDGHSFDCPPAIAQAYRHKHPSLCVLLYNAYFIATNIWLTTSKYSKSHPLL